MIRILVLRCGRTFEGLRQPFSSAPKRRSMFGSGRRSDHFRVCTILDLERHLRILPDLSTFWRAESPGNRIVVVIFYREIGHSVGIVFLDNGFGPEFEVRQGGADGPVWTPRPAGDILGLPDGCLPGPVGSYRQHHLLGSAGYQFLSLSLSKKGEDF